MQYANIFVRWIFTNDFVAGYYGIAMTVSSARQTLSIASQAISSAGLSAGEQGRCLLAFSAGLYPAVFAGICLWCPFVLAVAESRFFSKPITPFGFSVVALVVCINIPATLVLLPFTEPGLFPDIYAGATPG